jgi:phosphopentomutase
MGVVAGAPPPTYPDGFPPDVIDLVRQASGRGVICNRPDNGIEAIEHFGAQHVRDGDLIVYTSQDSVLQIAAHVDVVTVDELYAICGTVRTRMVGAHAVGRVIARPFTGEPGRFERTDGRRDFALAPPTSSYLDALQSRGIPVHTVGKVGQLFAGVGIDVQHPGATNAVALVQTTQLMTGLHQGFVFVNLIETDQVYGHRKDVHGFARALRELDADLSRRLEGMRLHDLLIVTADHGVDPAHAGTDHTREYAPLLAVTGEMLRAAAGGGRIGGVRHDGPLADVGASVLRWLTGGHSDELPGATFIS